MKKDIYIIKNDLNNFVYIGQAKDTKTRFQGHCKPSSAKNNNSLIDKAIQKYGRKHFWFEILESQIENYNEKEIYWIKYYNSLAPNGYNLTTGGEAPPIMSGYLHPESKLSSNDIQSLTHLLQTTTLSLADIAKKYGLTRTTVCDFNKGKTYYRENIDYPIRKDNPIGKLSKKDVEEIINILKNSKRSFKDIGLDYNVEARAISRINQGIFHKQANEKYPLRQNSKNKISQEQLLLIIDLLQNTHLSLREIAKYSDISLAVIIGIKNGTTKAYRQKDLTYPLRPNN